MSRTRLPIVLHLPPEQIYRRYRACRTGVEKTHWHLIWLLTRAEQPLTPAQAAAQVGLTGVWARAVLKRWNADGPAGLADRRAVTNGGRGKLTTDQRIDLWAALQQPPPDGGLWTGPKVRATPATASASRSSSRPAGSGCAGWVSRRRCRGLATRRRRPRPSSRPGKEVTGRWVAELRRQHPDRPVEVWAEDEARLGLKPISAGSGPCGRVGGRGLERAPIVDRLVGAATS